MSSPFSCAAKPRRSVSQWVIIGLLYCLTSILMLHLTSEVIFEGVVASKADNIACRDNIHLGIHKQFNSLTSNLKSDLTSEVISMHVQRAVALFFGSWHQTGLGPTK